MSFSSVIAAANSLSGYTLLPQQNQFWRYRWNNAGSRIRAGTVLTVGEGDTNVIVGEIIEYFPHVDNNVPLPSTLERLDSEVLQPLPVR